MSSDVLQTLSAVNHFLIEDVLSALPGEMRGEMRAAIKNISDVIAELPGLQDRLANQNREMQVLLNKVMIRLTSSEQVHIAEDDDILLSLAVVPEPCSSFVALQLQQQAMKKVLSTTLGCLQHRLVPAEPRIDENAGAECSFLEGMASGSADKDLLYEAYAMFGKHAAQQASFQSVFPHSEAPRVE